MRADFDASDLKVIAFDVFGTVVDWHSGIAAEAELALPGVDGATFALAWRAGYLPAMKSVMERIAAGEGGFTLLDELHLSMLEQVLHDFGLTGQLDTAAKRHLSRAWHRLPAWPDAVEGLTRLKSKFTICTLSNGNIGLLTEMAKRAAGARRGSGGAWRHCRAARPCRSLAAPARACSGAVRRAA